MLYTLSVRERVADCGSERFGDFNAAHSASLPFFPPQLRSNTDVTVAVDGDREFPAHKIVLSACSEFFKEHFEKSPCAVRICSEERIGRMIFICFSCFRIRGW